MLIYHWQIYFKWKDSHALGIFISIGKGQFGLFLV